MSLSSLLLDTPTLRLLPSIAPTHHHSLISAQTWPPPQAPAHSPCFHATTPTTLPAVVVVVIVIVAFAIIVVAVPPCSAIAIAKDIAIPAPGWCIIGSTMATALLFLEGGISHGQAARQILWKWRVCHHFLVGLAAACCACARGHDAQQAAMHSVTNRFS